MVMVSSSGARVTVDMGVSYSRTPAWSDGASYRARPADLRNHGQILRFQSIVPPLEPQGGYSRFCCSRLSPGSRGALKGNTNLCCFAACPAGRSSPLLGGLTETQTPANHYPAVHRRDATWDRSLRVLASLASCSRPI